MSAKSETEIEIDSDADRKKNAVKHTSVSDISINSPSEVNKRKKKKSKTAKNSEKKQEIIESEDMEAIRSELKSINKKMSNVLTKDDKTLNSTIKDIFKEMKDELLKSVFHRIELLESNLFDKETENADLKKAVDDLQSKLEKQDEENEVLKKVNEKKANTASENLNNLEQYGRKNNILINGLAKIGMEDMETTTNKLIHEQNTRIPDVNLTRGDIDIAHRLGPKKPFQTRPIIVRFVSRMRKDNVIKKRRALKGSRIYLNEDLTHLNQTVLISVLKKTPDEVEDAWFSNGKIFKKDKMDIVTVVPFKEYQDWLDLPFQKEKTHF